MNDSAKLDVARELILAVLSDGPMKGATLKLRILGDFERRTGEPFNSAFRLYPKFSSFLAANADLVEVVRPPEGVAGDITVRLRQRSPNGASVPTSIPPLASECHLRHDVWQALTNPDPNRRRFFDRNRHTVVHYLAPDVPEVLERDAGWVEIKPATADEQASWVREFAEFEPLPESKRRLITLIGTEPYSSQANADIIGVLAEYSGVWRAFRASKVIELAHTWSAQAGIPFEAIAKRREKSVTAPKAVTGDGLRDVLLRVIASASEDELRQIQLPASLFIIPSHANAR